MDGSPRGLGALGRHGAALLALGVLGACGGGPATAPSRVAAATPAPTPVPVARYVVTFDAGWSASTHPTEVPPTPHFSGLIGATHRDGVRFWEPGGIASDGIKRMAELGGKSPLDTEIAAAVAAGLAEHELSGGGIRVSPGSVGLEFDVSSAFPLVSLVSMVAPSPDWFVGVTALPLLENGEWRDEIVVSLWTWDAGTDGGTSFLSRDRPLEPRLPISVLDHPLGGRGDAEPLGTFTFRRLS